MIRSRTRVLRDIYERQFRELTTLRNHIISLLPLNEIDSVFEPGCGTGLLARELMDRIGGTFAGMDIDGSMLPPESAFKQGDAEADPMPADMYVSSFFFSSLKAPGAWLTRVRSMLSGPRLFAVFAEYDYTAVREEPVTGLRERIMRGLERDGINTATGGELQGIFADAGYRHLHGGSVIGDLQPPDPDFVSLHAGILPKKLPLMSWRVVWGIWKAKASRP